MKHMLAILALSASTLTLAPASVVAQNSQAGLIEQLRAENDALKRRLSIAFEVIRRANSLKRTVRQWRCVPSNNPSSGGQGRKSAQNTLNNIIKDAQRIAGQ